MSLVVNPVDVCCCLAAVFCCRLWLQIAMAAGGVQKLEDGREVDVQNDLLRGNAPPPKATDEEDDDPRHHPAPGAGANKFKPEPKASPKASPKVAKRNKEPETKAAAPSGGGGGFSFSFSTSDKPPEKQVQAFKPPEPEKEPGTCGTCDDIAEPRILCHHHLASSSHHPVCSCAGVLLTPSCPLSITRLNVH